MSCEIKKFPASQTDTRSQAANAADCPAEPGGQVDQGTELVIPGPSWVEAKTDWQDPGLDMSVLSGEAHSPASYLATVQSASGHKEIWNVPSESFEGYRPTAVIKDDAITMLGTIRGEPVAVRVDRQANRYFVQRGQAEERELGPAETENLRVQFERLAAEGSTPAYEQISAILDAARR